MLTRLGLPNDAVPIVTAETVTMETAARVGQSLSPSVNGNPARRVTIEESDTLRTVAAKISNALGMDGDAKVVNDGHREYLEIQALNGSVIRILAGPDDFDALPGLGLEPERLIGEETDLSRKQEAKEATFELGFTDNLNLSSRTNARDAVIILDNAMREVRNAFRFLTEGPAPDDPFADLIGSASPYLVRRIAAFEDALLRIRVLGSAPTAAASLTPSSSDRKGANRARGERLELRRSLSDKCPWPRAPGAPGDWSCGTSPHGQRNGERRD